MAEAKAPPLTKLSTQPYRGTKDLFPEDQRLASYIAHAWRKTCLRFGYEEYAGPLLEPIELYLAKTSEEIVNEQLYHVHDKGDRHLAIRPEITPTLARMVASRLKQLPRPIRWYSIPSCMRYERPQKSRLRQFEQFNLDILGGSPLEENIEVLLTIVYTMKELGARPEDFVIKINHRGLVNDFLATISVRSEQVPAFLRLLDGHHKMPSEAYYQAAQDLGIPLESARQAQTFMTAGLDQVRKMMTGQPRYLDELQTMIHQLGQACRGWQQVFRFAADVMRGFDYYTGMVFEVFDQDPQNHRALFGGGRYDNLVGSFGSDQLSGVGYGVSDISLINFLKAHQLLPELHRPIDVIAFAIGESCQGSLTALAMDLRMAGLNVEQVMSQRKPGKAFAHADKMKASACVFIGQDELTQGQFQAKWLASGLQKAFSLSYPNDFVDIFRHDNQNKVP